MSDRPSANQQSGDKKKKETILDLGKYLDNKIRVKFSGGREASGILKGTLLFFLFVQLEQNIKEIF